jgi:hypothetical protein
VKTLADPRALAALAARLEHVSNTQARVWGTMTPHQMLVHLAEASETAAAGRPLPPAPRAPSRVIKWIALYAPFRWPRGVQLRMDPAGKVLPAETFDADRRRAIAALRALASTAPGALPAEHPFFGSLSQREWLRWAYLHTDHHLRQFGL